MRPIGGKIDFDRLSHKSARFPRKPGTFLCVLTHITCTMKVPAYCAANGGGTGEGLHARAALSGSGGNFAVVPGVRVGGCHPSPPRSRQRRTTGVYQALFGTSLKGFAPPAFPHHLFNELFPAFFSCNVRRNMLESCPVFMSPSRCGREKII